jgi:hypothetical protein
MQREEILAAIKRTADENGGKPLGRIRFENTTGIGKSDWLHYWSRFSDAQREAGLAPNELARAYPDEHLFEKAVELARELDHYPTYDEFRTKSHNDPGFPSRGAFERLGIKTQFIAKLMAWCADKPEYSDIVALIQPLVETFLSESDDNSAHHAEADGYGFVYLLRGHPGEYKVGYTKLVDRRLTELGATSSVEQKLIHEIKTDDPSGVEAYWHKRFQDKRMRGEWFRLNPHDVKAFKRWRRIY